MEQFDTILKKRSGEALPDAVIRIIITVDITTEALPC